MQETKMKKLLLMGRSGAGKTSMHSIIFANYPAKETVGIGYTVDVNESKFKFLGNLTLNLWDCGGQDQLMKHYFTIQKEMIFKNVEVLIYVFDIENQNEELQADMADYQSCIQNLAIYSKAANIFILIHKMDKIKEANRESAFERKKNDIINVTQGMSVKQVFGTSIWDETLYKAWSSIVQLLIPNRDFITTSLKQFCTICDCDEIVLFERSTFLIIAYFNTKEKNEILKYERLSNIVKQFKLSCNKNGAQIQSMSVTKSNFSAYIEEFTENTYMMAVFSDENILPAVVELNIESAKKYFSEHNKNEMDGLFFQYKK